mmetsp:Transcript_22156/g.32216  ORF Transcript_22156/g.32216 Transcript_22156/m.32216 type:complete len:100 (-) Transcript_22156:3720-4019(-)
MQLNFRWAGLTAISCKRDKVDGIYQRTRYFSDPHKVSTAVLFHSCCEGTTFSLHRQKEFTRCKCSNSKSTRIIKEKNQSSGAPFILTPHIYILNVSKKN